MSQNKRKAFRDNGCDLTLSTSLIADVDVPLRSSVKRTMASVREETEMMA
jgi:hypothetical protein